MRHELIHCIHCGNLPPVHHVRCVRCDAISCCVVTDDSLNWLCEDCTALLSGEDSERDVEVYVLEDIDSVEPLSTDSASE